MVYPARRLGRERPIPSTRGWRIHEWQHASSSSQLEVKLIANMFPSFKVGATMPKLTSCEALPTIGLSRSRAKSARRNSENFLELIVPPMKYFRQQTLILNCFLQLVMISSGSARQITLTCGFLWCLCFPAFSA